ncbi:MAG: serine/threonine-protein kinase [Candidatus Sulfotelmatobacter sp.]
MQFLHLSVTILALWGPATWFDSLKREISFYLPVAAGFGLLLLIFGSVPFLISFLRGRGNDSLNRDFVTGIVPTGPLAAPPEKSKTLVIGKYQLASTLGSGGMATVFKGVDRQGHTVAIKMIGGSQRKGTALRQAKASEDSRIGLVREARLAAGLRHPNIVEIYDIGQSKGVLYIVMELLEGKPLDQYARTHPISAPEALRMVAQICDALDCAHSHGIVHRDIKPLNVFVTEKGTVKVLDFGIAQPTEQAPALGTLDGTPSYMSPEQIMGGAVDGRTDVWSAGVTLFQLLTTRMPFQGRTWPELRGNILNSPTPKLPFAGPFADELNRLMDKALAKDREKRYASAREFAADLRGVLEALQTNAGVFAQGLATKEADSKAAQATSQAPQTYTSVKLGFRETLKGPVFVPAASTKKGRVGAIGRGIPSLGKSLLPWAWTVFVGGIGLAVVAIIAVLAILFGLLIVVPLAIFEFAVPPPFFSCRSCRRRMRSVSVWIRPTWLAERGGFCERDCMAALKAGMWEEAVKLLWIHTSEEKSERRCKLEFFECAKCRDQRAYLAMETLFDGGWELQSVREAYRFGIAENEQRFLSENQSLGEPMPTVAESVPTATAALQKGADFYNRPTM